MSLFYATDEMLRSPAWLTADVGRAFAADMGWMIRDAVFNGSGKGRPLGITKHGSYLGIDKETGQAADTIVAENIEKMWARVMLPARKNFKWFYDQSCEPQFSALNLGDGFNGQLVYMPAGGISGAPYNSFKGRPAIATEHHNVLGDAGDFIGTDLGFYRMVDLGAPEQAVSVHVQFLYGETVFRLMYHIDGESILPTSAITPASGGDTVSATVYLKERA